MISIDDLAVTQNGFRNESQIGGMIEFVATGGIFDHASLSSYSNGKDIRPITVARFEDGRLFIHDGHHRVLAVYLGGRKVIYDSEYVIKDWKYSDYTDINVDAGWVTPYDPRIEVRISDYSGFKAIIAKRIGWLRSDLETFISDSRANYTYCKPRTVLTVKDLLRYI